MRCCARLLPLTLALAPQLAVGQAPAQPAASQLSGMIADAIAARWGVEAATVALDWDVDQAPVQVRSFRLSGSGADGTWLATFVADTVTKAFVVRAGIEREEQVAAHDMARGAILENGDIAVRRIVRWGPPVRQAAAVPGWETQRRIRAGEPLRPPAVAPPLAIRSGEEIQIEVVRGTVTVTAPARAAGSARIGEPVYVRNGSGIRLRGMAIAPGLVRIGGTQEER